MKQEKLKNQPQKAPASVPEQNVGIDLAVLSDELGGRDTQILILKSQLKNTAAQLEKAKAEMTRLQEALTEKAASKNKTQTKD